MRRRILFGPFSGSYQSIKWKVSKRKILGVYEHNLNNWISTTIPLTNIVIDVGANDGYFTYGAAHLLQKHRHQGCILAFEPGLAQLPELKEPSTWPQYKDIQFEFIPKFVGSQIDDKTITLNSIWQEHGHLNASTALIKVDVEGGELDVLAGSSALLTSPHHWLVEVHGDHLLEPVQDYFRQANREIKVIRDRPHWLFGPEARTINTSWVVTVP
jgi:hypothetical protein